MSKLSLLRADRLVCRVLNRAESHLKHFSTLNRNKFVSRFGPRKNVEAVATAPRAGMSKLAGPISADNVLSSPYGDVTDPGLPLTDFLFQNHSKYPDRPAITCGTSGRSYSYGMCRALIKRTAKAYLAALHLQPGDTVGLVLPNIPEFVMVLNGAFEAGLKITFANPLYTEDEISRQFLDSNVKCIVTIEQLMPLALAVKEKLSDYKGTIWVGGQEIGNGVFGLMPLLQADHEAELPKINLNEAALIPYSSGTTGLPKGVMLSHKNLVINLQQILHQTFAKPTNSIDDYSTVLTVPPFFHIYGFNGILNYNLRIGNHVLSIPRFTPEEYLKCLRVHKPSVLFVVPSLLSLLASHPMVSSEDLSSIREIVIGAAPTTESTVVKFLNKCGKTRDELNLQQGFGMTESSPCATLTPFSYPASKLVSVGQLVPGTKAKVVSLTKNTNLGPNSAGELIVKGPQLMLGYLNNEKATKETIDEEGWLHTGDVAYYDEDHFFYIVDRTKELIKVKGNQVSPSELENVIMELPTIADAAVVGIPDHLAGEIPKAFVVLKKGAKVTEKEIYDWVAKKVVKYKHLTGGVSIIEAIPRNPGGKIMRNELKVLGGKKNK